MRDLIIILAPTATFGLIVRDGRIIDAPPIARWCIGLPLYETLSWFTARGDIVYAYAFGRWRRLNQFNFTIDIPLDEYAGQPQGRCAIADAREAVAVTYRRTVPWEGLL